MEGPGHDVWPAFVKERHVRNVFVETRHVRKPFVKACDLRTALESTELGLTALRRQVLFRLCDPLLSGFVLFCPFQAS
jgi:hypothetical protein